MQQQRRFGHPYLHCVEISPGLFSCHQLHSTHKAHEQHSRLGCELHHSNTLDVAPKRRLDCGHTSTGVTAAHICAHI